MMQTLPTQKTVTFTEFLKCKPENKRCELNNGVVLEMNQPLGDHELIILFLNEIIKDNDVFVR